MAAGLGTRMRPLTFTKPKFLLPIAGKPALDHVVSLLRDAKMSEVGMVVGYGKEQIMERYGDGSEFGVKLEYITQRELLGTANAVEVVKEFVAGENFLVMNGDTLIDLESLNLLLKLHERKSSDPAYGGSLTTVEVEEPERFGIVFLEGDRVTEIVEKPKAVESKLANAGVYVFDPAIFEAIGKTERSERGEYELTASIQILINEGKHIYASPVGMWADVGMPWDLLVANEYFMRGQKGAIHGRVEVGAYIEPTVYVGEWTVVRSGSYIQGPTYIGKNCIIGPNCFIRPSTCIGDRVHIGAGVEIKNSIVMDDTNIAHLAYVGDSVIGCDCNLGAGTTIANLRLDDADIKMEVSGRIVSTGRRKLGTIIADRVRTGVNCMINPGVKIGPDSAIGPGAVIYEDVPSNVLVPTRPTLEKREWKPPRRRE